MSKERLDVLARRLQACQKRGNRMALANVLESARILQEAKSEAKRGFHVWLRTRAHMESSTARRHLQVARFVERNRETFHGFANLGLAKLYALSTLGFERAQRILRGEIRLSQPIETLTTVQFRTELLAMRPTQRKRTTRYHAFLECLGALTRVRKALHKARKFKSRFSINQRRRLQKEADALMQELLYLAKAA